MLYPVLQRMEMDGLIASRWKASDGGRPRRYYRITEHGRAGARDASWPDGGASGRP